MYMYVYMFISVICENDVIYIKKNLPIIYIIRL